MTVGTRRKRVLRPQRTALFAAVLSLNLLVPPAAKACDPMMAEERALLEATLEVHGRQPVTRTFQVPASSELIVLARESGLDVTLEVTDAAGHTIGRADNPIRRTGIQRVDVSVTAGVPYNVKLVGKEDSETTGRAEIRVVQVDAARGRPCLKTDLLLAGADAFYAMGQAITHGLAPPPGTSSAQSAYKAAASGYREASERLERAGPSALLAQSQHAEAAVQYQDLRAWTESKQWAVTAARTYRAVHDDYGDARARALEAAALLEIVVSGTSESASVIAPQRAAEMFARARAIFASIAAFHAERGESHDEALALNNIGLASYY
jgi:hypothetical protein